MARLSGLMLTLLLIVGATGLLSAPAMAMAMDTMESSALERGEQIFNSNCAACHMGGGNVIRANRTLKISDLNDHVEAYSSSPRSKAELSIVSIAIAGAVGRPVAPTINSNVRIRPGKRAIATPLNAPSYPSLPAKKRTPGCG